MPIIVTTSGAVAGTIISRAMRLLAQLESGEAPTDEEMADGLVALNAMLDSWRNERLMCWAVQTETVALTAATSSFTIGPSGTQVTTRPIDILGAYVTFQGTDTPVAVIDEDKWASIPLKTATANYPDRLYYMPAEPNGTIYIYPVPNTSSTLNLQTRTPLTAFSSSTDAIQLPPGWEEALATNLAIALAPEFEAQAPPSVISAARIAKKNIKDANSEPIEAAPELAFLLGRHRWSIQTDA